MARRPDTHLTRKNCTLPNGFVFGSGTDLWYLFETTFWPFLIQCRFCALSFSAIFCKCQVTMSSPLGCNHSVAQYLTEWRLLKLSCLCQRETQTYEQVKTGIVMLLSTYERACVRAALALNFLHSYLSVQFGDFCSAHVPHSILSRGGDVVMLVGEIATITVSFVVGTPGQTWNQALDWPETSRNTATIAFLSVSWYCILWIVMKGCEINIRSLVEVVCRRRPFVPVPLFVRLPRIHYSVPLSIRY